MRISDWSSDVCSSDLAARRTAAGRAHPAGRALRPGPLPRQATPENADGDGAPLARLPAGLPAAAAPELAQHRLAEEASMVRGGPAAGAAPAGGKAGGVAPRRHQVGAAAGAGQDGVGEPPLDPAAEGPAEYPKLTVLKAGA